MSKKREQIEEALGPILEAMTFETSESAFVVLPEDLIGYFAEQVVIECEVEHKHLKHPHKPFYDRDVTHIRGGENNDWHLVYNGTLGKPGKYFFIGVPLKEAG